MEHDVVERALNGESLIWNFWWIIPLLWNEWFFHNGPSMSMNTKGWGLPVPPRYCAETVSNEG